MLNQLGHLEDHIRAHAILLGLAVDFQPETDLVDGGELGLFDKRASSREKLANMSESPAV